jgi:hypothetical protein
MRRFLASSDFLIRLFTCVIAPSLCTTHAVFNYRLICLYWAPIAGRNLSQRSAPSSGDFAQRSQPAHPPKCQVAPTSPPYSKFVGILASNEGAAHQLQRMTLQIWGTTCFWRILGASMMFFHLPGWCGLRMTYVSLPSISYPLSCKGICPVCV